MYGIIFFELLIIFVLLILFFHSNEKLKVIEKEKEIEEREKKKDELKESIHTGNNHDDIIATLDLVQNNKTK